MERKKEIPAMTSQNGNGTAHARFQSYVPFLEKAGIHFSIHKPWLIVGKSRYEEQWIICLSVCIKDAGAIFQSILPILKEHKIAFSMIADQLQHNRINNHAFPMPLFGKAFQIFPDTPANAVILAQELAQVTNLFSGVFIPGCIRLGSILYATYSTKNMDFDPQNPNSLPFSFNTKEIPIPFPPAMIWQEHAPNRFLKKHYLPIKLIRSSHKGNILKGLDLHKLTWVFIKQANSWAGEDIYGREMRDRLCWQHEVADRLEGVVRTPKMLDFVDQEGYSYLITEYCDGVPFEDMILSRKTSKEAFERILEYYYQVLIMVSNMHSLDYVHRDLTAKNILIHDGYAFLTDFELAYRLGEDIPPFASGTIGYMSPEQKRNERPYVAEDMYTLGALLYYIVSLEHPKALSDISKDELEEKLRSLHFPPELTKAVVGCLEPVPEERWSIYRLIDTVEAFLPTVKERRKYQVQKTVRTIGKKLVYSGILAIFAGLTVIALWLFSKEPNSNGTGFERHFIGGNLKQFGEYILPADVRYLAGRIRDQFYFSTILPGEMVTLSMASGIIDRSYLISDTTLRYSLSKSNMLEANRFGTMLYDGNSRMIIDKKQDGSVVVHRVPELFTRAVRISENSVALRKFKPGERDQYLYRFDLLRGTPMDESRVTDPSEDGGLITGGMLDFDMDNGMGVYVTRYANRIFLLDTSMQIIAEGSTVDTFRNYTIKSQTIVGGGDARITNASPAYYVNKAVAIHDGLLYVNSYVKADNETAEQFRESNVIDVYRVQEPISTPVYAGSFRLATENKNRIRNFHVNGDTLTVLTSGMLRSYHLPESTFKSTER
ncbi:serine/threonine protein kinase [Sphingobacterium spiritivorum]|uniref:serine/threonine protein kinase n=2 Tax=Sphingobacterium spiritivorum TaxID=258 RepID=UPI003DA5961B